MIFVSLFVTSLCMTDSRNLGPHSSPHWGTLLIAVLRSPVSVGGTIDQHEVFEAGRSKSLCSLNYGTESAEPEAGQWSYAVPLTGKVTDSCWSLYQQLRQKKYIYTQVHFLPNPWTRTVIHLFHLGGLVGQNRRIQTVKCKLVHRHLQGPMSSEQAELGCWTGLQ